jgi:hypothetical protein
MALRWGAALLVWVGSVALAAPSGAHELARTSETVMPRPPPAWLSRVAPRASEPDWLPPLGRFGLPWEVPSYRRVEVMHFSAAGAALSIGTIGAIQTDHEGTFFAGERLFSLCDVPGIRFRPAPSQQWEVGAGILLGINKNFTPGNYWGLMTLGRTY